MIASLEGKLASILSDRVVITVGGVGYLVYVPFNTLTSAVGDAIFLHTILIVREDSLTLYGFSTITEREMFEKLITVSGVGPRMALNILGTMSLDRLHSAIAGGQAEAFTRVPGVGKKTAEKIIFELKGKIKGADGLINAPAFNDVNKDVLDALISFGYSVSEAQAAINAIPIDTVNEFEERMRLALQYFVN